MRAHNCEGGYKFNCQIHPHLSQHIPVTSQHLVLSTTHGHKEPIWSLLFWAWLIQYVIWVWLQGPLQVVRLEQVQAHLGAEGWDGAKPWMLQALLHGILLCKKRRFLLAWAWFGFAVSCLANYSLVKERRPFTALPSTQNEVITGRKRLSFWRNFLIPHTPPPVKHPRRDPWAGIRAIPNSLGDKYLIALRTCRFP